MKSRNILVVLAMIIGLAVMVLDVLFWSSNLPIMLLGLLVVIIAYAVGWFYCGWNKSFQFPP